jgi:MFS family permease
MKEYYLLLRDNPDYARLWLAQAISLLGDWFSTIALSALVVQYSDGSGLAVTLLLITRFLPPLLIGPFAGVIVDRVNRKNLLLFSDISRLFVVLLFLAVNDSSRLWVIYVLSLVQFSFGSVFEPARSAILPSVVKPKDLVKANVLGSVTWSVMLAAGAAIGGGVSALFGTQTALIIDAASFALSALCVLSIKQTSASETPQSTREDAPQSGFRDGLRYLRQHPVTALALLIKMGGNIGSMDTFIVLYATKLFIVGEEGTGSLGILYSAFGLGALIGPFVLERFNNGSVRTMRRLIAVGYGLITIGLFLFGNAPTLAIASVALFIRAMGSSVYWTYSSVIIQKSTPDHFLGRLFALDFAGAQLATIISATIIGWLVEISDPSQIPMIVVGTAVATIVPLVLWILALPWAENQERIGTVSNELTAENPAR